MIILNIFFARYNWILLRRLISMIVFIRMWSHELSTAQYKFDRDFRGQCSKGINITTIHTYPHFDNSTPIRRIAYHKKRLHINNINWSMVVEIWFTSEFHCCRVVFAEKHRWASISCDRRITFRLYNITTYGM